MHAFTGPSISGDVRGECDLGVYHLVRRRDHALHPLVRDLALRPWAQGLPDLDRLVLAPSGVQVEISVDDSARNPAGGPDPDLQSRIHHQEERTRLRLHSSACAAREIGGPLTADSPGPGHGACFRLILPLLEQRVRDSSPETADLSDLPDRATDIELCVVCCGVLTPGRADQGAAPGMPQFMSAATQKS